MAKERLIELIDQLPFIKSRIHTENIPMISGYDFQTRLRKSGGINLDIIYKDPQFQLWCEELNVELLLLKQGEIIDDLRGLLNGFNGWRDKSGFLKSRDKITTFKIAHR